MREVSEKMDAKNMVPGTCELQLSNNLYRLFMLVNDCFMTYLILFYPLNSTLHIHTELIFKIKNIRLMIDMEIILFWAFKSKCWQRAEADQMQEAVTLRFQVSLGFPSINKFGFLLFLLALLSWNTELEGTYSRPALWSKPPATCKV